MNYRKLRGRIVEIYGSQRAFAKELGVTENSVSRKMQELQGMSRQEIDQWAEMLNIKQYQIGEYFFAHEVQTVKQGGEP